MEKIIEDKIYDFLAKLNTEVDIISFVDIKDIDIDDPYYSIYQMIEDSNGFDIEIIYYHRAIEYLRLNDASLHESLSIASEYGYDCKDLNSEILASLLASQNAREEFSELQNEIEDFFEEIKNELEELEEDE